MPRHRVLHLSDTHVSRTGPDEDGVDGVTALRGLLYDVRRVPQLDVVVVSGDIADDGSEEGCATVRDLVGEFAAERGIPHIYSTGNHDRRDGFTAALGSGHLGPDGSSIGRSAGLDDVIAAVSEINGLRVITLDSLVPGSGHGELGRDQLQWLTNELATPAPSGSIVVLHHPPVSLDAVAFMRSVVLQQPEELGRALAGTDVHAVLCGHLHHQLTGRLGQTPVWVTPGVITRIDLTAPPALARGVLGAGATVIDLGGPSDPMFHTLQARTPATGQEVYVYNAVTAAHVQE
ncbi:metallophosphoesterase [Kribbella albertanoniae]|uniref:Metallophosphoesterase n=1 Tax=Kribbella albertanoniae TaxID=1266829 RepID=A0A4R4QA16_9ACTN|nr:metallophosphoesterase [Kribbella albertanoniae]TDC32100.1 metallophosphoesterase [Kribbella albertanoniae]